MKYILSLIKSAPNRIVKFFGVEEDQEVSGKGEKLAGAIVFLILLIVVLYLVFVISDLGKTRAGRYIARLGITSPQSCMQFSSDFDKCVGAVSKGINCSWTKCGCGKTDSSEKEICDLAQRYKAENPESISTGSSFFSKLFNEFKSKKAKVSPSESLPSSPTKTETPKVNCYDYGVKFGECTNAQAKGLGCVWYGCGCGFSTDKPEAVCQKYNGPKK